MATWRLDRNHDLALKWYDRALAIARRVNDQQGLRVFLNNSGNLFREPGTYAEAERRYGEGLAVARREGIEDAMLLKNQGIVFRETNRRTEGEQLLLRSVAAADRTGNGRIQWQGRMELGTLYRDTDAVRAGEYFDAALGFLEAQHNNVLLERFRAGALSGAITIYDDPYELYIDLLLKNGRERDAFFISERARA